MMNKKGFTLVELMVVIVIIGVLAAVAIPKFSAATNKAKASEAPTALSNIVSAEETYYAEMTFYVPASNTAAVKSELGVDISHAKYFDFAVVAAATNATTFGATATTKAGVALGTGGTGTIMVDDQGNKGASTKPLSILVRSYTSGKKGTMAAGTGVVTVADF